MTMDNMSDYDRAAWEDLARWRESRLSRAQRSYLPKRVRDRVTIVKAHMKERFDEVPGSGTFLATLRRAMAGALNLVNRWAEASLRRQRVIDAYAKRGFAVGQLDEIRRLDLRDIDRVKPRLDIYYASGSAIEGVGAGFAVSGGEIVAGGGAIAGAGAGAAPGAGTVVSALAVDAVAVLTAMTRVIAHTAAYYGYDTELPQERVFALGVLNFGVAGNAGKGAAYLELHKIVNNLGRNATWQVLDGNAVTKLVKIVYEKLGERLTKQKLGQTVPLVGIVIGGGLNARLLAMTAADADRIYRERFLREKYRLPLPEPTVYGIPHVDQDDTDIVQLIDERIDEANKEHDEGPRPAIDQ